VRNYVITVKCGNNHEEWSDSIYVRKRELTGKVIGEAFDEYKRAKPGTDWIAVTNVWSEEAYRGVA